MKTTIGCSLIVLTIIGISGCAGSSRNVKALSGHYVKGLLGFAPEYRGNKLYVQKVDEKTAAEKMGLKAGDQVRAFNGKNIITRQDRIDFFNFIKYAPHQPISLTVGRQGSAVQLNGNVGYIQSKINFEAWDAITLLGLAGDKISMAFIVDEIKCPVCIDFDVEEWKAGIKTSLLSDYEQVYLSGFSHFRGFKIVDRGKIDQLISELKFQQTGTVSPDQVKKIGKMAGATHIAFISLFRTRSNQVLLDSTSLRIVNVEEGTVLASEKRVVTVK